MSKRTKCCACLAIAWKFFTFLLRLDVDVSTAPWLCHPTSPDPWALLSAADRPWLQFAYRRQPDAHGHIHRCTIAVGCHAAFGLVWICHRHDCHRSVERRAQLRCLGASFVPAPFPIVHYSVDRRNGTIWSDRWFACDASDRIHSHRICILHMFRQEPYKKSRVKDR